MGAFLSNELKYNSALAIFIPLAIILWTPKEPILELGAFDIVLAIASFVMALVLRLSINC